MLVSGVRLSDDIDDPPVVCAVQGQLAVSVGHGHQGGAGVDVQTDAGLTRVVGHQAGLSPQVPDLHHSIRTS